MTAKQEKMREIYVSKILKRGKLEVVVIRSNSQLTIDKIWAANIDQWKLHLFSHRVDVSFERIRPFNHNTKTRMEAQKVKCLSLH